MTDPTPASPSPNATDVRLIGAVSHGMVAGATGRGMLWDAPADLSRFKELTSGTTVVMGRATFEAIGRALPNRKNVVLCAPENRPRSTSEDVFWASDMDEALSLHEGPRPAFVIGGTRPWTEGMQRASHVYLTRLDIDVDGDVLFPEVDPEVWAIESTDVEETPVDGRPARTEFITYVRR